MPAIDMKTITVVQIGFHLGFFTFFCNWPMQVLGQDKYYWYEQAKGQLYRRLNTEINYGVAKNVIFFVGDGMGLSTVTAARILRGQKAGHPGEETELAFERFPYVALSKTYNVDSQVGDSAACATALMCGVKGKFETLGLDDKGEFEKCSSSFESRITCLMDWAQQEGKATALVTNTRVTHATPAALYAHVPSRYWEDETKVPEDGRQSCKDIARQLVDDEPGRNINVIFGGGRRHFLPATQRDPRHPGELGKRKDGRNLIDDWIQNKKKRELSHSYVWTAEQLQKLDPEKVDYVLGLFATSHMDFESDRDRSSAGQPSLADMTKKAIEIVRKNPHGYFLMVEGGRIDHAHHYSNANRALHETLSFEESVAVALTAASPDDTLMVVTADHSHVFAFGALEETLALEDAVKQALATVSLTNTLVVVTTDHSHVLTMGGYSSKGQNILGLDSKRSDVDNMPYTTLLYANGPGYDHSQPGGRPNLTGVDTGDKDYVQQSAVPRRWETHGGEDVPVYAHGPMSHLFQGVLEQSYIAHAMAYAACMGHFKDQCAHTRAPQQPLCDAVTSSGTGSQEDAGIILSAAVIAAWWCCLYRK